MTGAGTAVVRVHREGPVWRWTYEAATDGVPLTSSIAFTAATEAEEAARTAYPQAELVVEGASAEARPRRRHRRVGRALLVLAGAAVVVQRLRPAPPSGPAALPSGPAAKAAAAAADPAARWATGAVRVRLTSVVAALARQVAGDLRNAWRAGAARGRRKASRRRRRGR